MERNKIIKDARIGFKPTKDNRILLAMSIKFEGEEEYLPLNLILDYPNSMLLLVELTSAIKMIKKTIFKRFPVNIA